MCRNIRRLHNYRPPATAEEIHAAALQYIRKVSGSARPSAANREAFDRAVEEVAAATSSLLDSLTSTAAPRSREADAARDRERSLRRFPAEREAPGAGNA